MLEIDHNLKISKRTVQGRMFAWQHRIYQHIEDSNQLKLRISNLFMLCYLKDDDI